MKRSEINRILADAEAFFEDYRQKLPPFAAWTMDDWRARAGDAGRIVAARLGWDVTDFGRGDFARTGLLLFTVRNGRLEDLERGGGMVYAEKAMIVREGQHTPLHRHPKKTEDIINRGGAALALKLFAMAADGGVDRAARFDVVTDGIARHLGPGDVVRLSPGESITLMPGTWHGFWGEGGDVFVGEVSTVNDDETDNVFAEDLPRYPTIEEDEPPRRRLVGDYGTAP